MCQSEVLRNTPANEKDKVSKTMHRVMDHNQLFYCTNNEIVVGDMPKTDMTPIHAEVNAHINARMTISAPFPSLASTHSARCGTRNVCGTVK